MKNLKLVVALTLSIVFLSIHAEASSGSYVCKKVAANDVAAALNNLQCDVTKPFTTAERESTNWTSGYGNVVSTKTVDAYQVCCVQK